MDRHVIPEPSHKSGDVVSGFHIDTVTPVNDVKALCYECTHQATGAALVHLHCGDRDNMYAVSFRTPPTDSAGEAHILEHSVLAGSKKYPLRGVFEELKKTSMATYLNASTFEDKTLYPVSSAVRADFWNLADVYTDVTLHPLIARQTFMQEGHHFEFEKEGDIDSALTISGVVYNEMKGAMSSAENIVYQELECALYPDTAYAFNSGGDPDAIPDLSYEALVEFHRRHYSPSNATWFLYGDIPLREHLAFVDSRLQGFSRVEADASIKEQPRWTAPRQHAVSYPVASDESIEGKTFISLGWLAAPLHDVQETLLLQVLGEALLGSAAGPLRKALVDSGLGQDLLFGGYIGHKLQGAFAFFLRGSEPDRAERVQDLAFVTLRDITDRGLDADLMEAAFHKMEFSGREIRNSCAPNQLLVRMAEFSNYGIDPKNGLLYGSLLAAARERWLREPDLFQGLIQRWLLDNPHRVLSVVSPSQTMAKEKETAFKARMAAFKATMDKAQLERIRDEASTLKTAQGKTEAPEALNCVPHIAITDVPRSITPFPSLVTSGHTTLLTHPVFSNGILAVDLAFNASDLSDEEILLLPFLAKATLNCGATGFDYAAMATRIARSSGGLGFRVGAHERPGAGSLPPITMLILQGSALERNIPELFTIFRDLILSADYSDAKRIKDLAHSFYNGYKSRLSRKGSAYAALAAAAGLSPACHRNEMLLGFTQIKKMRDLAARCDSDAAGMGGQLRALADRLFSSGRLTVNLTGEAHLLEEGENRASRFVASLPEEKIEALPVIKELPKMSVGVAIQSQINHVARVFKTVGMDHAAAPALKILSFIVGNDYLHKKLRVQGGAYGGYAEYNASGGGLFKLVSYRDPRLADTVSDFNGFIDYLRSAEFSAAAVEKARIGVIGANDYIFAPWSAGERALSDHVRGISVERRNAFREGLFTVTIGDIRKNALPMLEEAYASAPKAVVGSREAIEKANAAFTSESFRKPCGREAPFLIMSLED